MEHSRRQTVENEAKGKSRVMTLYRRSLKPWRWQICKRQYCLYEIMSQIKHTVNKEINDESEKKNK